MPSAKTNMKEFDLITAVQPDSGYFCLFGSREGKPTKQTLFDNREDFDRKTDELLNQGYNVFFAVAKYKTAENRKKENVQSLKAFWLDIDCAPGKEVANETTGVPDGYANKQDGGTALRAFCKTVGLPKPTIVNSGRGYHVYWILEEEVTREEWEPVAERLRDVCLNQELYVDRSVFEVSRILRVPGTLNFKQDPPLPVAVEVGSSPIGLQKLKDLLGVQDVAPVDRPKRTGSVLDQCFLDNLENNFTKIMQRSAKGKGCAQLHDCYVNRATLSEPRWFNALSIAKFCYDKDKAIHKLSEGHPDYDPANVQKKIDHILGPHSCKQIEINNPGGCKGCPHKGKIKNPLALGQEVLRADEDEGGVEDVDLSREPLTSVVEKLPTPPDPFFYGQNGGLYMDVNDETPPKLVYEHDIYVVSRMNDPDVGDVAVIRVHLPQDGVREFVIPNTKITDAGELKNELSKRGILGTKSQYECLNLFIINSLTARLKKKKADTMRSQFGWVDNDTKFIVGTREITADGVYHATPASATETMAGHFEKQGSLEEWKKVWALYGREGMEVQAFAALVGFASPLLKYTEQKGVLINLIHKFAGTGKTTVLRMANSVCGNPQELLGVESDTYAGKILKAGILNNICNTIDELTNIDKKALSSLVYDLSQGKGKDKSETHSNRLRTNNVTWRNFTLTSSNASHYQKLGSLKENPDGEYMRLLEFKVDYTGDIIGKDEGREHFDHILNHNYGHAIEPFIQYVISDPEEVKNTIRRVQKRIDMELKLTQRERNWSAAVAVIITAGLIAERLGLLVDWDINRIFKKVTPKLLDMRETTTAPLSNAMAVVGDYVNRFNQNILIVEDAVDQRTKKPKFPILEPRGALLIRQEPDTQLMFLTVKHFRNDCNEFQIDYRDTIKELQKKGIYKEACTKRLGKGMRGVAGFGTHCVVLDCSNPEFFDVSEVIKAAKESAVDADRESEVPD